jgi:fatty acid desaturase
VAPSETSHNGLLKAQGEWRTVLLIAAVYGGTIATVLNHDRLGTPLTVLLLAWFGAWHLSMQHEMVHGHPFRASWLNAVIASIPVTLWIPFLCFKRDHLEHHESDLTNPELDNESYYVSQEAWDRAGRIRRAAYWANRTLLFRMFVWVIVSTITYLTMVMRQAVAGTHGRRQAFALHAVGLVLVVWFVRNVAELPLWQFALGTTYGGRVLNALRPFPEHKYLVDTKDRTAMIMAGPIMSLLMLNNNLHVAHHDEPWVPWYAYGPLMKRVDAVERARKIGLLYEGGYLEVFRRYAVRPISSPLRDGN